MLFSSIYSTTRIALCLRICCCGGYTVVIAYLRATHTLSRHISETVLLQRGGHSAACHSDLRSGEGLTAHRLGID